MKIFDKQGMEDKRKRRDQLFREGFVKVRFLLEQDADGYPPAGVESLWARPVEDGYQLDNIPFFARSVSCGDVVAVDRQQDGTLQFRSVVRPSGHSTVRVMVTAEADAAEIREQLREIGCSTEGSHIPRLFSVDIPAEVDYKQIRELLQAGAATDRWEYEESALADHVS